MFSFKKEILLQANYPSFKVMKSLYKSAYVEHEYDEETRTLYSDWSEETADMSLEDFRQEMTQWAEVSKNCKPQYIYDYCVYFLYSIPAEENAWLAELLNPVWIEAGVQRYAHVVPDEFITNLSVDKMFEAFTAMNLPNQFAIAHFSDRKEAMQWLRGE